MVHFILADNQELTRFAEESMIRQTSTGTFRRATDRAGLVELLKENENSVVLLDFTLFDFADEEQLLIVSERFVMAHWILISDQLTPRLLRKMVYSSHRFSIVFKDGPLKDLREALQTASEHRRFVCQRAMELILAQQQEDARPELLTATETEIVKSIARGLTTRQIAEERFSSVHTITTHRKNIFRKLGINTAHELTMYALRAGLVDSSDFNI